MNKILLAHEDEYGDDPVACASVPARFHLLGEHTWFAHGNTLSMAINYNLKLCASKRQDNNFKFFSMTLGERRRVSVANLKYRREDRWTNSLKAILASFYAKGYDVPGLNFTVSSDIPSNAGLGTPNALKVAAALVVGKVLKKNLSNEEVLRIVEHANTEYLNTHPHTSDILCVLKAKEGHCVKIDNKHRTTMAYPINLDGYSIILTDSHVPRSVVREELSIRLNECFSAYEAVKKNAEEFSSTKDINEAFLKELDITEATRRRVVYIIRESQSVEDAVEALKRDDRAMLSRIFIKSHEGLRNRFEISCPELDWLVKRALEFIEPISTNLVCARMTGKGFGGCIYSILRTKDVPLYKEKLEEYERIFGFRPRLYSVVPSDGATFLVE